jgi:hypothetical protein
MAGKEAGVRRRHLFLGITPADGGSKALTSDYPDHGIYTRSLV